jgi:Protein of unknown function (DUF1571)
MRRSILCWPLILLAGCTGGSEKTPAPPLPAHEIPSAVTPDGKPAPLPDNAAMENLARTDPVQFLKRCLQRYERDVQGYRCMLVKKEHVLGKDLPEERIRSAFRERPYSVLMVWEKGAGKAAKTLYVEGENNGKLVALPANRFVALSGTWTRDVDDDDARAASRYPITQFGLKAGSLRTLDAWLKAQKRGDLQVNYLGEESPAEYGGRPCWKLKRVGYKEPEDNGVMESTLWFDKQTWLQVGSYLTGEGGRLVGRYAFLEIELNPTFDDDTFTRAGLTKKK